MKTPTSETVKSEHTPTPWQNMSSHKSGFRNIVSLGNDAPESRKWICEVPTSDTDDAQFIVTACNAHDVLLDACKLAEDFIYQAGLHGYDPYKANPIIAKLQTAIYNAKPQATNT